MFQDAPLTVLDYTMNKGGMLNFTYFMVISEHFFTLMSSVGCCYMGGSIRGVTGELNILTSKDTHTYILFQNLLTTMSIHASFSVMEK